MKLLSSLSLIAVSLTACDSHHQTTTKRLPEVALISKTVFIENQTGYRNLNGVQHSKEVHKNFYDLHDFLEHSGIERPWGSFAFLHSDTGELDIYDTPENADLIIEIFETATQ